MKSLVDCLSRVRFCRSATSSASVEGNDWPPKTKSGGWFRSRMGRSPTRCMRDRWRVARHLSRSNSSKRCPASRPHSHLQPWVDRFTFQCQYAEDAFVDSSKRFVSDEAFQALDAEGEFSEGEGAFGTETSASQPGEILFGGVVGAVDDSQVFPTPAFHGRLHQAFRRHERSGLPTTRCQPDRPHCR